MHYFYTTRDASSFEACETDVSKPGASLYHDMSVYGVQDGLSNFRTQSGYAGKRRDIQVGGCGCSNKKG